MNPEQILEWADAQLEVLRGRIANVERVREGAQALCAAPQKRHIPARRQSVQQAPGKPAASGSTNGLLEGKVLEALLSEPMTKRALAERFLTTPEEVAKVLAKLRGEGEVEPTSRQAVARLRGAASDGRPSLPRNLLLMEKRAGTLGLSVPARLLPSVPILPPHLRTENRNHEPDLHA